MKTAEYIKQSADLLDGIGYPWYSADMRTIKKAAALLCIATLLALTMSCSFINDVVSALFEPSVDDWNGETETWDYPSAGSPMFLVSSQTRQVDIKLDRSSDIFMVRMNPSTTTIPSQQSRYVVSTGSSADNSGRTAEIPETGNQLPVYTTDTAAATTAAVHPGNTGFYRTDFTPAQNFVPPLDFLHPSSGRNASGTAAATAVTPLTPVPGTTQKKLWVDLPASAPGDTVETVTINSVQYTKRSATLRDEGEYCYIWVVDGYYSTDSGAVPGAAVTESQVSTLREKFDGMYPLIREIFGKEAEVMVDGNPIVPIAQVSDTGSKVNIVVYDINGDYKTSQQGGVFGYFWAKDYYTPETATSSATDVIKLSNSGKYFYIDSYFTQDSNWAPSMYSTLAHEFQHMINFGVKTLTPAYNGNNNPPSSATWYTEMMSMLCEDMMQQYLECDDTASPKSRLSQFCTYYTSSGITEWNDNAQLASYAVAYTFGAYLARNYGGAELIQKAAQNGSVDKDSITEALKAMGYDETFDSAYIKFAQALIPNNTDEQNTVTLNKDAKTYQFSGYTYPMTAIDLWSYNTVNNAKVSGPVLYSAKKDGQLAVRPYGFTLHQIGYTQNAGSVSLTFSSPVSQTEQIYVLVQPRS